MGPEIHRETSCESRCNYTMSETSRRTSPLAGLKTMPGRHEWRLALLAVGLSCAVVLGQGRSDGPLRAHLHAVKRHVNVGEPIWVEFRIQNVFDEPAILFVPGTEPEIIEEVAGLPLAHVFSGQAFSGLTIRNQNNRSWNVAESYQPPGKAPVITLGPRATIGLTLDVRRYYSALGPPGTYRLSWAPYGASVESNMLVIEVAPLKQATIVTDLGEMTIHFFYDETPRHIDNFVELAKSGFYNNLKFHHVEKGYYIQGGCPNGDGRGIRPDGVKLAAEFTSRPQTRGSVSMARLEDDADSASCQFFITNTRVPEWDGRYTIFGELVGEASFATLDKLMALPANANGGYRNPPQIRAVRISDAPRQKGS